VVDQQAPRSRRQVLRAGGAAALVGLLGILGRPLPASAQRDDKKKNTREPAARTSAQDRSNAGSTTSIEGTKSPSLDVRNTAKGGQVMAVHAVSSSPKGTAIAAEATAAKGETVAVLGTTESAEGVGGRFVATGGGTAIEARAGEKGGVALRTKGRLQLTERSGIASVSGGAEFVIPVAGGVSETSIVLATLQDHHTGVHVESARVLDVERGLIVVRLNAALPEPSRVGWMVLDQEG
jgi:hypothetical protein